jgi:hypothetical protein
MFEGRVALPPFACLVDPTRVVLVRAQRAWTDGHGGAEPVALLIRGGEPTTCAYAWLCRPTRHPTHTMQPHYVPCNCHPSTRLQHPILSPRRLHATATCVWPHVNVYYAVTPAHTGVIERVAWGAVDVDALTQELGEHHTIDIPDGCTLLPGLVDCHSHPTFTNDFNFSRR